MGLVGWVFADLMLALVIVFLATQPGDPRAGATPTTTTTTTTTTAPATTTTTKPAAPPSVDSNYICIRLQTDPSELTAGRPEYVAQVAGEVNQKLKDAGLSGRRAGIVLIFGVSSDLSRGSGYAKRFNELVVPAVSGPFVGSARRPFYGSGKGQIPEGSIELNIYPLVGPTEPRLPGSPEC